MLGIAREANMPVARAQAASPTSPSLYAPDAGQVVRHIYARKPHQLRELSAEPSANNC